MSDIQLLAIVGIYALCVLIMLVGWYWTRGDESEPQPDNLSDGFGRVRDFPRQGGEDE